MATKASNIAQAARTVDATGNVDGETLDGLDSSQFLRSDTSDTMSGNLTVTGTARHTMTSGTASDIIRFANDSGGWVLGYAGTTASIDLGTSDSLRIRAGATEGLRVNGTEVVVNEISADVDFRVESNGATHMLFVDGNLNRVGINSATPTEKLEVGGAISSTSNADNFNQAKATFDYLATDGAARIGGYAASGGSISFYTNPNGNNVQKRIIIDPNGHFLPVAHATYDLGSAALAWRNIYTGDLHMSNMSHDEGNSVDGTKGDWTFQEGEAHLYLINNITGKKYAIQLTEIKVPNPGE